MKHKIICSFLLAIIVAFVGSCAAYVPVSGKYNASEENFTVDLPQGWRQHNASMDPLKKLTEILEERHKLSWDVLRLTRDGLLLQQICIGRIPVEEELPNTKRKLAQGMIPLDAAELISDNFSANGNLTHQEIFENSPAIVGGHAGFKLGYRYRTKEQLKIDGIFYGALMGSWLYYALYEAPAQHYFAKDLAVFETTVASFQIVKTGP